MGGEGAAGCGCTYADNPQAYQSYLKSRPKQMEVDAITVVTRQAVNHAPARCHIVHLSAANAIPLIEAARQQGASLSVETCHHYLSLTAEQIPDARTEFKCAPPVREAANQADLWQGLIAGQINMIVSDHSPSSPDVKLMLDRQPDKGDFLKAWGGISSCQLGLSLFWTQCQAHGLGIADVIRLMSSGPAKLCGYQDRKAQIKAGFQADFCVWSPEEYFRVSEGEIAFKNKTNPYSGQFLQGVVYETVLAGEIIYSKSQGAHNMSAPKGRLLLK